MPFKEGNQHGKKNLGRRKDSPKTIWLLQSLADNGVNLEELLAKSILRASKGDRQAMDLAHLLAKLIPHVANAPKSDTGTLSIDTLVINRYQIDSPDATQGDINRFENVTPATQAIDTEVVPDEQLRSGVKAGTDTEGKG